MHDFAKKRRVKEIIYSPISIFLVLVVIGLVVKGDFGIYKKYKEAKSSRQSLEEQFAELKDREEFLNKEIDHLNSPLGKEERVRQMFNVKKKGEEVVVIVSSDTEEKTVANTTSSEGGFLQKMILNVVDFFQ